METYRVVGLGGVGDAVETDRVADIGCLVGGVGCCAEELGSGFVVAAAAAVIVRWQRWMV